MVHSMTDSGTKTLSTVMESRLGLTAQFTTVSTRMVKSMARASFPGPMEVISKETSRTIKSKDGAFTLGPTAESLLALGLAIKWTATESLLGKTAESTKVIIKTIKKKDLAFSTGRMDVNMKVNG